MNVIPTHEEWSSMSVTQQTCPSLPRFVLQRCPIPYIPPTGRPRTGHCQSSQDLHKSIHRLSHRQSSQNLYRSCWSSSHRPSTQGVIRAVPRTSHRHSTISDDDGGWFFNLQVRSSSAGSRLQPESHSLLTQVESETCARRSTDGSRRPHSTLHHLSIGKYRKDIPTPSAKKIRDVIHMEKTSSKGDTLIFHNLPLLCDETLERQVVNFCQNFLVVGIRKLQISDVHRMEPRFGNDGPITVHVSHVTPRDQDRGAKVNNPIHVTGDSLTALTYT